MAESHLQSQKIRLGLKYNWKQFVLLVIVNAFVGGMIGMERSIFPQFAQSAFGISSHSAILSFIIAFGISKALANYFTGKWSQLWGRKKILMLGWTIALPIPFILMNAQNWDMVVAANVLLGLSQGFTWSSTIIMKIDLAGEKDRGLAMGLNEFAGYVAVGFFAWLSGWIAFRWGITPYPFYLGIALSGLGWLISLTLIKDTSAFVQQEGVSSGIALYKNPFQDMTWKNKILSAINQAGWVNNLNDGMMWGIFPILLFELHYNLSEIGLLTAAYPMAWGIGQLFTGKLADYSSPIRMIFWGMIVQGLAIVFIAFNTHFLIILPTAIALGIGTALVYPTFTTLISKLCHPRQRAELVGTFRLWRDLGYVFGAIISGWIADHWGVVHAIFSIGIITLLSGLFFRLRTKK
jgi:MFS family permease